MQVALTSEHEKKVLYMIIKFDTEFHYTLLTFTSLANKRRQNILQPTFCLLQCVNGYHFWDTVLLCISMLCFTQSIIVMLVC